jgi:phasin family protein
MQTNNLLQFVNEASNVNKSLYEAVAQLSEANAQTWEKLINVQFDLAGAFVDGTAKQLKLAGEAKDVREFVAAQAKFVEEFGNKIVQNARQQLAIISGARDAYTAWVEQGVDQATENLRRNATKRAA